MRQLFATVAFVALATIATSDRNPAVAQSIPEGQSCGGLLCDMGVFGHKTVAVSAPAARPVETHAAIQPAPAPVPLAAKPAAIKAKLRLAKKVSPKAPPTKTLQAKAPPPKAPPSRVAASKPNPAAKPGPAVSNAPAGDAGESEDLKSMFRPIY